MCGWIDPKNFFELVSRAATQAREDSMPSQRIAIVGAGPKAAAIATKAACLRDLAELEIDVVIYERDEVGAAWTGNNGYTDGLQRLCTPAERDIGFPYDDTDLADGLAAEMQARYSWKAYCIARGKYGEWVDRGRQKPIHRDFADYLFWCIDDAGEYRAGNVTGLSHRNGQWSITYTDPTGAMYRSTLR